MFRDFVDFVRWNELVFLLCSLIIGYIFFRWWGVGVAFVIDWLNHLGGGAVLGADEHKEPRKIECSAGIKDCGVCVFPYSHEFNVEYGQTFGLKKWYQKII